MGKIKQFSKVRIEQINHAVEYTLGEGAAKIGDIGSVVEIYKLKGIPDGYEVECVLNDGATKWLAIFYLDEISLVK